MATYAIGDIQGCASALEKLLHQLRFDPGADRVWLCGDLVNRGAQSVQTLRLLRQLGDSVVAVLGNHDLHLLAVANGIRQLRPQDTLQPLLDAADAGELLDWLRHRPLLHWQSDLENSAHPKAVMVHAGLYPLWDAATAADCATEVETHLHGENYREFLTQMYGQRPTKWSADLAGWARVRFSVNALTRMRFCNADGELEFSHTGPPGSASPAWQPWFAYPDRKIRDWRIVFGHWSALGFFQRDNLLCLDSGCAWGGVLTALQLDGDRAGRSVQQSCE